MAIAHKFANTQAKSLLEVLQSNVQFLVPRFQRNYSWKKDKVEVLWADLIDGFSIDPSPDFDPRDSQYLLGPIVLVSDSSKPNSYLVIDGQQRLSTLTMLLCVARDVILDDIGGASKPDGFEKILGLIQNTHMGKRTGWKLELNDTDKAFFREIQEYEDDPQTQLKRIKKLKPKSHSLKLLKDSYILLHELITNALYTNFGSAKQPDMDDEEDNLRKLRIQRHPSLLYFLTHVLENHYLIQIVVDDDNSAFQIFETLNERGQTLSRSNLIKNHILNKITNEPMQIEQSNIWNKIFDEIVGDNQSDDDFIMESYNSRNSDSKSLRELKKLREKSKLKMSKKNLYKIIKILVDDETSCKRFIKELESDASFLSTLNDPTRYDDDESKDAIYTIKALRAQSIRIPILAAYRKWRDDKPKDYSRLVKILAKFFFKIRTVREEHPGHIEEIMTKITKKINEGSDIDEIKKIIKGEDDHERFKQDFKTRFVPKPAKEASKYVLQQITIKLGTNNDDVRPIDNLTLEHILPSNHDGWNESDFLKEYQGNSTIGDFKYRLGNLTLLNKAVNSKLRNSTFELKKNGKDKNGNFIGYMASSLMINKKTVCNYDEWTGKIIEERESKFAEYADEIWSIK